jgi:hypothetical protein
VWGPSNVPKSANEIAPKTKALFAGCVRDCAFWLPSVLRNIERIASLFDEAAFIFVENDSQDATKQILRSWCSERNNSRLISLDGLGSVQPVRTLRLARARREYIAALKADFSDYSYLIVLDFDDVNASPIDAQSVQRAVAFLESDALHAGVFANQDGVYYDLWALRHPEKCPRDVWEEVFDCAASLRLSDEEAFNRTFSRRVFSLPSNAQPLEVDSAFGGFGIYKVGSVLRNRSDFIGFKKKQVSTANGNIEVGWQVCEHVSFNHGFRERHERLFVLPYLVNANTGNMSFAPSFFRGLSFGVSAMTHHGPSVGQREPCPCGSGKKYKHCHGASATRA